MRDGVRGDQVGRVSRVELEWRGLIIIISTSVRGERRRLPQDMTPLVDAACKKEVTGPL